MLGMFHLFPLLKGWERFSHSRTRTVVRGADPIEVLGLDETGWLMSLDLLTDDAYGTVMIDFQGAELQTRSFNWFPELAHLYGAYNADAGGGGIGLYHRPNPYSTEGIYEVTRFMGCYYGSTFPYVPTVVIRFYLPTNSTQSSAQINGLADVVAIVDKKAFVRSLRRIWDIKSLKIDPALLVTGPAEFEGEK